MEKLIRWYHCAVTLTIEKPKEVGLFSLMVLIVVMAVYKSTPPMVAKNFELKIEKNRTGITSVFQERDITKRQTVWVDKLMLKDGARIVHPKLGAIGFSDNFFIDIESSFRIKKPNTYYFIPGSDDGFALDIDGKRLCEFEGPRPYATQRCKIDLEAGVHTFKMTYHQGAGHSGLTLAYQEKGDRKKRWFGENSKNLKFD